MDKLEVGKELGSCKSPSRLELCEWSALGRMGKSVYHLLHGHQTCRWGGFGSGELSWNFPASHTEESFEGCLLKPSP